MRRNSDGFALIDLLFTIGILGVLFTLALPRLSAAKRSASEASALGTLRVINSAQISFAITCGNGFYAPNLSTLGTPPAGTTEAFIAVELGSADIIAKSGYTFEVSGTAFPLAPTTCNGLGQGISAVAYKVRGDPMDLTNPRYFGSNSTGVIYVDTSSLWGAMPESAPPASGQPIY